MFGLGNNETPEQKAAEKAQKKADQDLANKLAGETPDDEQVDLYPQTPQLGPFGEIPAAVASIGGDFVDRKDKA